MPRVAHCILAASLAALLLAGCGNKGALVLPDQQPKKHKNKSAAPATPAAKAAESKPEDPASGATDSGH